MSKRQSFISLLLLTIMTLYGGTLAGAAVQEEVSLKVLDPRSQFWGPSAQKLSPRLDSLDGKRIALVNNGKAGGDHMIGPMAEILQETFPAATIQQYKISFFDYANKDQDMKQVAEWADTVIELLGD